VGEWVGREEGNYSIISRRVKRIPVRNSSLEGWESALVYWFEAEGGLWGLQAQGDVSNAPG